MRSQFFIKFCLFITLFGFLTSNNALAQNEQDILFRARNRSNLMPYGQIVREVEQHWNGRVVGQSVQQTGPDQWVYDLRILQSQGQVIRVIVDAQTGRLIFFIGGR